MADDKTQNQPQRGDTSRASQFGSGVQNDANKGDADKADASKEVTPKTGGQGADVPTGSETVPGGAYIVDGKVLDANGNERKDYKVEGEGADRKIVKA